MERMYSAIVDTNWSDRTLFPESIPHLLHQDLIYLWMLEREPDRRPSAWRDRLDGWRLLAGLFMLGQLDIEEEQIREPFARFTSPFGIDRVAWLRSRRAPLARIGVLSPTVLVRPLPDFAASDLSTLHTWSDLAAGERAARELRYFADCAARALDPGGLDKDSYRARLARVLVGTFGRESTPSPPAGRLVSTSILRSLGWAQPRTAATAPESVALLIKEVGLGPDKVFVPRCSECNDLLTRDQAGEPVGVSEGAEFVCLICAKGHPNEIALSRFLIWQAPGSRVVLWNEDPLVPLPSGALPLRRTEGIDVPMEWDPGRVGGDPRRYLRLRFPGTRMEQRQLDEVFFKKILIPGDFRSFAGKLIKGEWRDAVADWGVTEADPTIPRVAFRGMQLRGWPVPIDRVLGGLSIDHRKDVAVGCYPDASQVGAEWKWYRLFADGPGRVNLDVKVGDSQQLLPWLAERTSGLPEYLSVHVRTAPNIGASFVTTPRLAISTSPAPGGWAFLGVDFGTANTIIRYDLGESQASDAAGTDIEPAQLLLLTNWLAQPISSDGWDGPVGDFLPPRRFGESRRDPCLIPSAIWRRRDTRAPLFIRWGQWFPQGEVEPPSADIEPLGGFKWDPPGRSQQFQGERVFYLRELLLLTLPVLMRKLAPTRPAAVVLGLAFPLAFDATARRVMTLALDKVSADCRGLVGVQIEHRHVSESLASVNAFGLQRKGDVFLVADMGGGTLDLALFRIAEPRPELLQIGSLRFAGEQFISAVARRKNADERAVWELRDLIAHSTSLERYGDDVDAKLTLQRFRTIAGEFMRTMVAAFRQHEGTPHSMIKVVLVGNGWHLADAFLKRASALGSTPFFQSYYADFISDLGETGVDLYKSQILPGLRSSKHLVVRGALQNARLAQLRELQSGDVQLSKLPAGRAMTFGGEEPHLHLAWHRLVGDDPTSKIRKQDGAPASSQDLDFNLDEMPPLPSHWRRELTGAFGVDSERLLPYPDKAQLREQVAHGFEDNLMAKGPLQLIIERTWAQKLSE